VTKRHVRDYVGAWRPIPLPRETRLFQYESQHLKDVPA
jgi:hypothetical protein